MHNYKVVHNLQDIHSTIQLGRWRHQAVHNVLALQAVHNYQDLHRPSLQRLHALHNYQDLHQAIHLGRKRSKDPLRCSSEDSLLAHLQTLVC